MTRTGTCAALVGAIVLVVAPLGACGGPAGPTTTRSQPSQPSAPLSGSPEPSTEVWTVATVLQRDPSSPPELCSFVAQSFPPQCSGPRIVGWDWSDVTDETRASGVTWVDRTYVTGTYDGETFTLTRPPSDLPPPGTVLETPAQHDEFPALCEDPLRGAEASAAAGGRADNRAKDALGRHLERMDGYVGSWVSDHQAFMNVVVTGDAESARAQLRRLWAGRLCVEQRDVATHADLLVAQQALVDAPLAPQQCLSSWPGTDGRLHVGVTRADPDTVAAIHRAVSSWLDPGDVLITARLRPLTPQGSPGAQRTTVRS